MTSHRSFSSDLRVVLQGRDFRKLFAVRLASQASDGAFQAGLASLVFFSPERAATAEAAALAAVVTVLPYTLIGPFAGVLLDVWPRRQVLLVANAIRALMVLGVAGLILADGVGLPLYALTLACLSVNRFFLTGLGASLPHVVPRHELVMANAVSPTCGTVAALVGVAVAYSIRVALGGGDSTDAAIVTLAAGGYAVSALLAKRMERHLLGPDERAPLNGRSLFSAAADLGRDLALGARHVVERRRAGNALAAIGGHRIGYGVTTIGSILLCRNYFADPADVDRGVTLVATVLGVTGLGVGAAAFVTPPAAGRFGVSRWIWMVMSAGVVIQLAFAIWPTLPMFYVTAFVIGTVAQSAKICVDAIVQDASDDAFRGRVFALYDVVFNVAFISAAGLCVLLLPPDSFSRPVMIGIAVVYALTAAWYWLASRRLAVEEETRPGRAPRLRTSS